MHPAWLSALSFSPAPFFSLGVLFHMFYLWLLVHIPRKLFILFECIVCWVSLFPHIGSLFSSLAGDGLKEYFAIGYLLTYFLLSSCVISAVTTSLTYCVFTSFPLGYCSAKMGVFLEAQWLKRDHYRIRYGCGSALSGLSGLGSRATPVSLHFS